MPFAWDQLLREDLIRPPSPDLISTQFLAFQYLVAACPGCVKGDSGPVAAGPSEASAIRVSCGGRVSSGGGVGVGRGAFRKEYAKNDRRLCRAKVYSCSGHVNGVKDKWRMRYTLP